jgi:hypothetical protein
MIEVTVAPAPIGEEVASDATPQPFGWSYGTAIADGDRLRQYVLHHAHVPDLPDASVTGGATGTTTGRATADGGVPDLGTEAPTLDPDEIVTDRDPVAAPDESASDASAADTTQAQAPADSPDDGRVGIHLAGGSDGPILARDELRVTGTTATGFEVATRRTETDGQPAGDRPTICYRAWPVAEESDSDGGSMETSDDTDTTGTRQ